MIRLTQQDELNGTEQKRIHTKEREKWKKNEKITDEDMRSSHTHKLIESINQFTFKPLAMQNRKLTRLGCSCTLWPCISVVKIQWSMININWYILWNRWLSGPILNRIASYRCVWSYGWILVYSTTSITCVCMRSTLFDKIFLCALALYFVVIIYLLIWASLSTRFTTNHIKCAQEFTCSACTQVIHNDKSAPDALEQKQIYLNVPHNAKKRKNKEAGSGGSSSKT